MDSPSIPSLFTDILQILDALELQFLRCDSEVSDAALEALERALATSLARVREKKNCQVAINRLPTEILSSIFHHVPQPEKFPYNWPEWDVYISNCARIMKLTHVCAYWRDLALNTPTLWRRLGDALPPPTIVERARGVPLDLYAADRHWDAAKSLLSDGTPLRELHLSARNLFPLLLKSPAPDLEVLSLQNFDLDRDSGASTILFQGATPRLRELILWFPYILPSNSFFNLTRLLLSHPNTEIPLSKMLTWLSKSPNIEDLVLEGVEFVIDETTLPDIHLGRLRTFVIEDMSTAVANALFARVTVTPEAAIQLYGMHDVVIPRAPTNFDVTKIALWQWEKTIRFIAVGPSAGLMIETTNPERNEFENWYSDIMDGLPMGQIQEFWIETCTKPWLESVRSLMKAMPALTTLGSFITPTSASVLSNFRPRGEEAPICPNLETLYILADDRDVVPERTKLLSFLESRRRAGCPIRTLFIESYDHLDEIEGLDALVDHIDYRTSERLSAMDLPALCTTQWHTYWRSWKGFWE
ncbi:hypothetical protein OBBRIDRAFT_891028 [Obba rivulosa]|uniref:F-box domain-containing protein n=1 Tax=Obba rivulosa TaxID=1052685 RepID=A0A8E2ALS8_9APHY|nr:hypothetical protein OBBRIDRAFT_891028 [Obba rivulosa]